ncbi:MAG: hypothetical protein FJ027_04710 [Candidatus Rokubacteria bacterium]|nr:hypothetical protein [Candidatus Rokubacteria bacterium]
MLGERRLHLHDFVLFLVISLGIAVAIVAIFVATARPASAERTRPDADP